MKKEKQKRSEMTEEQLLDEAKKIVIKRKERAERWAVVRPKLLMSLAIVAMLAVTFAIVNSGVNIDATVSHDGALDAVLGVNAAANNSVSAQQQTTAPASVSQSTPEKVEPAPESKPAADAPSASADAPETNEEIVKKYTEVLNKMKQDQPGYTKKEYQALPEEYRNFSSVVNSVLKFGEAYMTKEDSPNAIVTATKGEMYTAEDGTTMPRINHELPICNTDKGSVLTDYSCVKTASCTDNADGTRTLRFELNDEKNPEPTPADTCVPQSYHGAVMMPASMKDINTEVDKVVSKLPGVTVNNFELTYRDSTFEVTYDPTNDHVIEIVHHINVDIAANAKVAFSTIDGTARLTNDMSVYDINY